MLQKIIEIDLSSLSNEELDKRYYQLISQINNAIDYELDLKTKLELEIRRNRELKTQLVAIMEEVKRRNSNKAL